MRKGFPGKNKFISRISSAPRSLMVIPLAETIAPDGGPGSEFAKMLTNCLVEASLQQ